VLAAERRRAIAEMIRRQSTVRLQDLTIALKASDSTIRRDLEYLEQQGVLERTYGGAILATEDIGLVRPTRTTSPSSHAFKLGASTAALIAEGETVFVGAGVLPLAVAHHLAARPGLTVITNGLEIASYLAHHSQLPVILTGGQLQRREGALAGHIAELALDELRADRAVLGVAGIHVPDGITGESLSAAQFMRAVIERMPEVVVVAGAEQWGHVGPAYLAPLEQIDVIVTSMQAPPAMVWDLSQLGIRIIQA
jgi:DeoR/GlpR family transcriptional regulator of sugar metabolism